MFTELINQTRKSFSHKLTWNWTYFCTQWANRKNACLKFWTGFTFQTQKLCSVSDHCYANNAGGVTAARSLWLARCFGLVTNQEFKWEEIVQSEVTQWSVFPLTLQRSWCWNLWVVVNLHSLSHGRHEVKPLDSKELEMNETIHSWVPTDDKARHISSVEHFIFCQRHLRHLKVWHDGYDGIILGSSCVSVPTELSTVGTSCNWSRSAHVKVH